MALPGLRDDPVGDLEELGGAPVVLREHHGVGPGMAGGEVEDVPHRRGPEAVDGLRVVPHHREPVPAGAQPVQQLRLEGVGVLVLVDQHVVELGADRRPRGIRSHQRVEEEEQVVVVQDPLLGLAVHVGAEQQPQPVDLLGAPGKASGEHRVQRGPGVHAAAVDVEAGRLPREAPLAPAQLELGPQDLEQVLRVAPVVDGEARVKADSLSVLAQQPGGDRVERPAPHPRGRRPVRGGASEQPVHPAEQLGRRPPGEGEKENALRRDAPGDELRHTVGEGGGLSGPGTRDHQERTLPVEDRLALRLVEPVEHRRRRLAVPWGAAQAFSPRGFPAFPDPALCVRHRPGHREGYTP